MQVKRGPTARRAYTQSKLVNLQPDLNFHYCRANVLPHDAIDHHGELKLESASSRAALELARCDMAASADMGRIQAIFGSSHQSCRSW
jgi:putative ubiquitin-RnfH superfamily antitoxin RatB of RatAB toxin-antitoxin module